MLREYTLSMAAIAAGNVRCGWHRLRQAWIGLDWSVAICIHPVDGLRDARKSSAAQAESMGGAVLFVAG
jgi:hypothetical protein